jgi:hypothetical protein
MRRKLRLLQRSGSRGHLHPGPRRPGSASVVLHCAGRVTCMQRRLHVRALHVAGRWNALRTLLWLRRNGALHRNAQRRRSLRRRLLPGPEYLLPQVPGSQCQPLRQPRRMQACQRSCDLHHLHRPVFRRGSVRRSTRVRGRQGHELLPDAESPPGVARWLRHQVLQHRRCLPRLLTVGTPRACRPWPRQAAGARPVTANGAPRRATCPDSDTGMIGVAV